MKNESQADSARSGNRCEPPTTAPPAASATGFDLNLIRKYNVPGPRYTSYPTAPHFSETVDRELLLNDFDDFRQPARPFSLYVHLPFCETACWFCGCTKVITRDRSSADRYLDYLEKEIQLIIPLIQPEREVIQLHFGGGTPTFLTPPQLRRLGRMLHDAFRFHKACESSVEIDPRRLDRDHITALREIGCNRASLGVQDNNPQVQKAINRIQPFELTEQAVRWLREDDFNSINIDLIYGLPFQNVDTFGRTVEEVLQLRPDRFAVFSYAHVPWIKPAQKIFDMRGNLPDQETKLSILQRTTAQLTKGGYAYIGMDHFALESDELTVAQRAGTLQRNFQGYSTRAGADIQALGMSAISQTVSAYRQNEKELPAYYAALDEGRLPVARGYVLTQDDRIRRETIMRLMCDGALDFHKMSVRLGIDFPSYFRGELVKLSPMEEEGLVEISPEQVTVTRTGRFLIRNIAMVFDAYLNRKTARFSQTV